LSLAGAQKLGYNPVYANWDAWAGHWKPKCVGKPQYVAAKNISQKLKDCWEANYDPAVRLVQFSSPVAKLQPTVRPFDSMGMDLPKADEEALARLVRDFRTKNGRSPLVCEVGSWAGRSAIIMAQAGARVQCVDTWAGSENDQGCKAYDGSRGTPFEVFLRNVEGLPITATVGKSPDAAGLFKDGEFDIVYIDAEHDRDSVIADIKAWKPKAKHILAGHDYHVFPGVREAVEECGLQVTTDGNVWQCPI
jgi:hypothetical protein